MKIKLTLVTSLIVEFTLSIRCASSNMDLPQVEDITASTGFYVTGPVTSWQTANGIYTAEHLAGQTPQGDLLIFWRQPDGVGWRVVNVTEITGKRIFSPLTSWQTPNGPYNVGHLAGRSPDNDLLVFFWQPDGRDWRVVNVSNLAGKKIVDAPRAYQILNNKENVEMIAARGVEGELLQFWWKPSRDWQVLDLTEWAGRTIASIPEPWVLSSNSNDLPLEYLAATNCNNHLLLFRDYAEERDVVDKMGEPVHGLRAYPNI